ncbi:MerR family transcriptional regulator [Streptomyces sp. N2-109]|uniref:MerR family transcriptional regulator n=1 Tax=Streptomyces gossypii TaxID=2883101 RepID=A0ABT2JQB4_9ACTN|nr:MerR family transcriptional regulator [Streptomyces gossypii]MCT2589464.1 MerR family transcriptional regulator [Streptomyces gossypii]
MTEITPELSIGQVAERTGLSVYTLRFYEREGILPHPVPRGHGGRRVYREDDVEWLQICICFRAAGMPLPAIRHYTELVRAGSGNEQERLALLLGHRERVAQQLAEVTRCLDLINHKIGIYEDHLARGTAAELWTGGEREPVSG